MAHGPPGPDPPQDRHRPRSRRGRRRQDWPDLVEAAAKAQADGTHRGGRRLVAPRLRRRARRTRRSSGSGCAFDAALERRRPRPGSTRRSGTWPTRPPPWRCPTPTTTWSAPASRSTGCRPDPRSADPPTSGCVPAMTLTSQVVLAKRVPAGQGVSYGHRYTTDRRDDACAGPARVRRRRAPASRPTSARSQSTVAATASPARSAWTSSCSTSAMTPFAGRRRGGAVRPGRRRRADRR